MKIGMIVSLENERMMEHPFTCVSCLAQASFKFPKKKPKLGGVCTEN